MAVAVFFRKRAVATFGVVYADLARLARLAVGGCGWPRPGEMTAGLGVGETTVEPLM